MNSNVVLVTGGAGYIGSHTCKALAKAGFTPLTVDNLSTGNREAIKWGPFLQMDIRDGDALSKAFSEWRPQIVLHFAAKAYVGESVHAPQEYYDNNVCGTHTLLTAMKASNIPSIVFSSSCATYGIHQHMPIREDAPQAPINPYGFTKLVVERELQDFSTAYGLRSVILRYFNAAGCDQDGELGENHEPETHLIPLAIRAALGVGPPLKLFGTDYDTPDGTAVRDYVHVADLANAHVRAAEYLLSGAATTAVNLGTGRGHSVREILTAVETETGRKVPIEINERRKGDPPVLVANPAKAAEVLNWTADSSDLRNIISSAVKWSKTEYTRLTISRD
jgi:UDP-arabinose 4-epimerase